MISGLVRLAAVAALVVATMACGGDSDGEEVRNADVSPHYEDGPLGSRVIRFRPASPRIADACIEIAAQLDARFPCPRQLPRANANVIRVSPALRIETIHQGRGELSGLSIEFGAPSSQDDPPPGVEVMPLPPWHIRPCCFFHATFEALLARPKFDAETTSVAGRKGFLSTTPGPRFTMYQDHLQFAFTVDERWALVTVHTAGSSVATRILLDRLVASIELIEPSRR